MMRGIMAILCSKSLSSDSPLQPNPLFMAPPFWVRDSAPREYPAGRQGASAVIHVALPGVAGSASQLTCVRPSLGIAMSPAEGCMVPAASLEEMTQELSAAASDAAAHPATVAGSAADGAGRVEHNDDANVERDEAVRVQVTQAELDAATEELPLDALMVRPTSVETLQLPYTHRQLPSRASLHMILYSAAPCCALQRACTTPAALGEPPRRRERCMIQACHPFPNSGDARFQDFKP